MDAAVAGAVLLGLCEPAMTGLGGDCFVLWSEGGTNSVKGLNASGRAPAAQDAAQLRDMGETAVPAFTAHAVTIPTAVAGFAHLAENVGKLGLDRLLAPSIHYAEAGIPVAPRVAFDWKNFDHNLQGSARDKFLVNGKPLRVGEIFRAPGQAEVLKRIAKDGADAFYKGEVAEDMVASLNAAGGLHTLEDFANARCDETTPISGTYKDIEVVEHPPNGQGATAILMLNILAQFDLAAMEPFGTERAHIEAEAAKLAYEVFEMCCREKLVAYIEGMVGVLSEFEVFPSIDEIIAEQIKNQAPASEPGKDKHPSGEDASGVAGETQVAGATGMLLDLANSLGGSGGGGGGGGSGSVPELDVGDVLQALSRLPKTIERKPGRNDGLKQAFLQQIAEEGGDQDNVPRRVLNALDMVDYMVSSVEEDEALTGDLREWVRKLEVTLGKEATRSDEFLNADADAHAAFQMLNQLENVDADTIDMSRGKRASARVDAVLERLVEDWDGDEDAFVNAVDELEPLVEQQRKLYERNLERVVTNAQGRARIKRARRIVLKCIAATFAGRTVPEVVLEIVQPAWRNLLVNTALREGTRAVVWKQQLKVLRRLAELLCRPDAGPAAEATVRVLVRCLRDGLESIGQQPRAGLLEEIAVVLADPASRQRAASRDVAVGDMAELLGWSGLDAADPMPPTGEDAERESFLENLRRARVMRTGSRVKFNQEDGEPCTSKLAWASPGGDEFVFVNRRGTLDRELSLTELTEQLTSGDAVALEGYDVPLVDRVSERMLSRIHGKITGDAQKDELTELANRISFERSLNKLVALARDTETSHCALQIDLDQFKLINSTSGYDGGDALLRDLSAALRSELAEHEGTLARIGADEFAAVLRHVAPSEGEAIAERLVRRVRHMQFAFGAAQHSITCTIGVLGVDQTSEDSPVLLQNLASACRAGKEQGGDCVVRFVEDDEAMLEQRRVMERASRVEQQLAEARVLVNCQQIAPASSEDPLDGHYEVLIKVLDENDEARAPVEFIEAAERYGKMPLVDRYVVSNVLSWMATHEAVLSRFGGFSINLSGQSIKQDDFLDFVLQEFETTGADPAKVCFEVTETAAMGNLARAAEFIQKIRVMGCRFSLDDFGTGMSSYAYLRELPVDYLKIDGTFVKNMATDASDYAVVKSINEIGHFMGKKTVAEYVHDEATLASAREIGVDYLQGWHIEQPKPIDCLLDDYPGSEVESEVRSA